MSAKAQRIPSSLTLRELQRFVVAEVTEAFPEEEFLEEELKRIVGGVLNGFAHGVLKMQEYGEKKGIIVFKTTDHLATDWMPRKELINHAVYTTGLPRKVVAYALARMENKIDSFLIQGVTVRVAWLGKIKSAGKGYEVELSETLQV